MEHQELLDILHDVNFTASCKYNGFVINGAAWLSDMNYKHYQNKKWIDMVNAAAEAAWLTKENIDDGC
jgi:hypothetical protein